MGFIDRIFNGGDDDDEFYYELHCPRCGSDNIWTERLGFSWSDAFWGNIIFGKHGWLFGFRNRGKIEHQCMHCGYTWRED